MRSTHKFIKGGTRRRSTTGHINRNGGGGGGVWGKYFSFNSSFLLKGALGEEAPQAVSVGTEGGEKVFHF